MPLSLKKTPGKTSFCVKIKESGSGSKTLPLPPGPWMGGVSPKSRRIYEKREEIKGQNVKGKRKDTEKIEVER